jgi:IS5 family transposase
MGGKGLEFKNHELIIVNKHAKREKFLPDVEAVFPRQALIALIETHYPKSSKKVGRLRIHDEITILIFLHLCRGTS